MSLRLRLTLLYTTLLGAVLLLFGVVVYGQVSVHLFNQIDSQLGGTALDIISSTRASAQTGLEIISFPSLDLSGSEFVQLWGTNGRLLASSPNVSGLNESMDPEGRRASQPVYQNTTVRNAHLRVLSVPLQVGSREAGILQVATSLGLIDATQRALLTVLIIMALVSMSLAAAGAWFTTGRALDRLHKVTEAATQITRADDLSRRIPDSGPATDEVGQLISSFNDTLSRLEKLFTAQRRFLADVSHELRTPLTVIKGNVGLIRRLNEVDDESLSGIEAEVDRMTRLVGDLLLLAQAESGKIPLEMRPVELDTVLLEVFQQMRVLSGDRIQLALTDIDQVQVVGDRDRLKQVVVNLVSNAIKYTPAGGKVAMSLGKSGTQARLAVSDTGPGIPAQDLPHIFERFYRAEKSRTRSRDGSGFGLGLSIAYWIVHHHGGRIEVDSKEGQGTSFCIWLPLAPQAEASK
jgi:heavy metal sensor kinase